MKIKKNDNVIMTSGKDKGKKGKILLTMPTSNKVVVEGLNMIKRHLRARKQGQKGQIVSKERSVSVASVALICKSCGKQTRIGYKIEGRNSATGKLDKSRICKKCKNEV